MKTLAAGVLIASSCHSFAIDEKLDFCSISGFAFGYNDILISRLAMRLSGSNMESGECHSAFRAAQGAGKRVIEAKPLNYGDKDLVQRYNALSKKIDDALLQLAGYEVAGKK